MSLPDLLASLEDRWADLGAGGVLRCLQDHARTLRPSERSAFLEVFDRQEPPADDGAELVVRIESFADRTLFELDELPYRRDRWTAKDDALPEASEEADDLLQMVGERFQLGERAAAARGLELLLDLQVSLIDHPSGYALGGSTDLLTESLGRLLWLDATDGSVPAADRADRVVEHYDRYAIVIGRLSPADVLDAHPREPGPDAETVSLIARRLATMRSPWRWSGAATLAAELACVLGGPDRVLALARDEETTDSLGFFRWLVDRHRSRGELGAARQRADEALARFGDSIELARLADVGAHLHRRGGSPDAADRARAAAERAWQAQPTSWRLAWVLADTAGDPAALDRLRRTGPGLSDLLDVALDVLRGDLGAVAERASSPPARVLGCLGGHRLALCALCSAGGAAGAPVIARSVTAALSSPAVEPLDFRVEDDLPDPPRDLAGRIIEVLVGLGPDPAWLDRADQLVETAAATVLGSSQRALYAVVAEMVAVLADAHERSRPGGGDDVWRGFEARYRRYRAFCSELAAVGR